MTYLNTNIMQRLHLIDYNSSLFFLQERLVLIRLIRLKESKKIDGSPLPSFELP